jgi:hypothetical protein
MNSVLTQSQLLVRSDAVQPHRVSRWLETMIVAAGISLNRPSPRSYVYLATELSRGTVLLGHLSRHDLMTALALMLFAIVLARTNASGGGIAPRPISDALATIETRQALLSHPQG